MMCVCEGISLIMSVRDVMSVTEWLLIYDEP